MLDFDVDGWPDLFVANDTQPNKLYRNRAIARFRKWRCRPASRSARTDAPVPAWALTPPTSTTAVCRRWSSPIFPARCSGCTVPVRPGVYADRAPGSELGTATRLTLGFGCFFFDADLDGLLDLLVVNGHIDDGVARNGRVNYAEPPHLFHNRGKGQFVDVAREVGAGFAAPKVGRGAAFGDIDLDGDLDVLMTTNGGPAASIATRRLRQPQRPDHAAWHEIESRRRSARTCAPEWGRPGRRGWCVPVQATCRSRSCR